MKKLFVGAVVLILVIVGCGVTKKATDGGSSSGGGGPYYDPNYNYYSDDFAYSAGYNISTGTTAVWDNSWSDPGQYFFGTGASAKIDISPSSRTSLVRKNVTSGNFEMSLDAKYDRTTAGLHFGITNAVTPAYFCDFQTYTTTNAVFMGVFFQDDDATGNTTISVSNRRWMSIKVTWYSPTLSAFINDALAVQIVTKNGVIEGTPWFEFSNNSAVSPSTVEIDSFLFKTQK